MCGRPIRKAALYACFWHLDRHSRRCRFAVLHTSQAQVLHLQHGHQVPGAVRRSHMPCMTDICDNSWRRENKGSSIHASANPYPRSSVLFTLKWFGGQRTPHLGAGPHTNSVVSLALGVVAATACVGWADLPAKAVKAAPLAPVMASASTSTRVSADGRIVRGKGRVRRAWMLVAGG